MSNSNLTLVATLYADFDDGEGEIVWHSPHFFLESGLFKADVTADWIKLLSDIYEKSREDFYTNLKQLQKGRG
ncbi:MAG: hypothetical protein GY922_02280 [Proteobacteria bacterium]|nr:hypothetical protein [Pseudomonadota bacterium]